MLRTLNIIDDIELSFVINIDDFNYRAEGTQSFRSKVFFLASVKHLVDSKNREYEQ